jgi:hypothetical protein
MLMILCGNARSIEKLSLARANEYVRLSEASGTQYSIMKLVA